MRLALSRSWVSLFTDSAGQAVDAALRKRERSPAGLRLHAEGARALGPRSAAVFDDGFSGTSDGTQVPILSFPHVELYPREAATSCGRPR
jgi:hypothetical protein